MGSPHQSPIALSWRKLLAARPELREQSDDQLARLEEMFRAGWEMLDDELQTRLIKDETTSVLEVLGTLGYEDEQASA